MTAAHHSGDPGRPARPINLNPWSVRGIIEGRKTQTRRLIVPQPPDGVGHIYVARYFPAIVDRDGYLEPGPEVFGAYDEDGEWGCRCPYGKPGDLLYGRETWAVHRFFDSVSPGKIGEDAAALRDLPEYPEVFYRATDDANGQCGRRSQLGRWRAPIHMPRWASRLALRVASIRVERLQSISEEDAWDEGIESIRWGRDCEGNTARNNFAVLWDHINGKRAPWSSNPWAWVVGFQRERGEGNNE